MSNVLPAVPSVDDAPAVYIASLAAYNNGVGHGAWVAINQDADAIQDAINAVLTTCPEHGEEWAIHDTDNVPGDVAAMIGEGTPPETLAHVGEMLEEYGDAWAGLADDRHDLLLAGGDFEDAFIGEMSAAEYAEELLDAGVFGEIANTIRSYIDVASIARDLVLGGDVCEIGPYLFRGY